MITPKSYLDNLGKCRLSVVMRYEGNEALGYMYQGHSIAYSLDFVEGCGKLCHVLSFDLAEGDFHKEFVKPLIERIGEPFYRFDLHGLTYYCWRADDADARA